MKIIGIDPGSHHVGVFVGEVDDNEVLPRMLRPIAWRTFEVGHFEEFPPAKQTPKRKGRWMIDETDVRVVVAEVLRMTMAQGVQVACVEWVVHAHLGASDGGAIGSIATHVARANFVGGALSGALLAGGLEVHLVPHRTWQARVACASTQKGRRGVVAEAIEAAIPALAGHSDEHVRDAAGCALYLVTPPPEPRARTRRKPRNPLEDVEEPRVRSPAEALTIRRNRARAAHREEREVAGCTCKRRHVRTCPLFQATTYAKGR